MLESAVNVASGYIISVAASTIIYPLFGIPATHTQITGVAAVFTVIGVIRSFFWRRVFNWLTHRNKNGTPS